MRTIPTALQTSLDTYATTNCFLLKLVPQIGSAFGTTSLDIDVAYDDGGGSITYSSALGLNQSAVKSSAGLEVDNSEALLLIGSALTKQDIAAGVLDYGSFYIYRIDYNNTANGHYIVQSGRTGIVRSRDDIAAVIDLRALSQQLKQNYSDQYSITCRAKFGSAVGEEMFPCLFDTTSLWQNKTVDSVGSETDRVFVSDTPPTATGPNGALGFGVAIVEFLTGDNAGLTVETETVDGADITLRFPSAYAIEAGDTFKIRPDCAKRFQEDCIDEYDNYINFRGEPHIPLTEEASAQHPGANQPRHGAPPVTNDPTDNDDPDLQGSIPWESRFPPLEPQLFRTVAVWVPSGGLTLAVDIPDTPEAKVFGITGVPNTSSNGTKSGSLSDTVGDFAAVPNSANLVSTGLAAAINAPHLTIANPTTTRDAAPGSTLFVNIRYTDGEANWLTIFATYTDAP